MNKKHPLYIKITVALVVVAALGLGGWKGWQWWQKKHPSEIPAEDTTAVVKGDITLTFEEVGEIMPRNVVDINSQASGRITELLAQEGQRVKAGDKLLVVQAGRSDSEKYMPKAIVAPMDGVIMRCVKQGSNSKDYRVGDRVSGSYESTDPTCILQLADMGTMVINMKISEMDILKLHENMPVEVKVDAVQDRKFHGKIGMIALQAESGGNSQGDTKSFRVRVDIMDSAANLRAGMSARTSIVLKEKKGVLKIPLTAFFDDKGAYYVYKYSPAGRHAKIPVTGGLRSDTEMEITEGLKEGDMLLTVKPTGDIDDSLFKAKNKKPQAAPSAAKPAATAAAAAKPAAKAR